MLPDERLGPKFVRYRDVASATGADARRARETLRSQLSRIAELGYRFVPMSDFVSDVRLGPRDAIVTFDDGLRSFIDDAFPVLQELGVVPTLFLTTEFVGFSDPAVEFLTWEDIGELTAEGVQFGCHGATHVPLDQVGSDRMRWEVAMGVGMLAEAGVYAPVYSYPFGRFDGAAKLTLRRSGYVAAFTQSRGGNDRFEIRRRPLTGAEGSVATRFVMSDRFWDMHGTAFKPVPGGMRESKQPVPDSRWGLGGFGVDVADESLGPGAAADTDPDIAAAAPREADDS